MHQHKAAAGSLVGEACRHSHTLLRVNRMHILSMRPARKLGSLRSCAPDTAKAPRQLHAAIVFARDTRASKQQHMSVLMQMHNRNSKKRLHQKPAAE